MVTSAANRAWPGDVVVSELGGGGGGGGEAGLPAASVVRVTKIATIDALDAEPIGSLPIADRLQVTATLRGQLALVLEKAA